MKAKQHLRFRSTRTGKIVAQSTRVTWTLDLEEGTKLTHAIESASSGTIDTLASKTWKPVSTEVLTGARIGEGMITLHGKTDLELRCSKKKVSVLGAAATLVHGDACGDGGPLPHWQPGNRTEVEVLHCETGPETALEFSEPPIEWVYENSDCTAQEGALRMWSDTIATASFEAPAVVPVAGTVSYADEEQKTKLLPKTILKQGDLTVGTHTIAGPCYDVTKHAALIMGLVDDSGKPTVKLREIAIDLDRDGTKDTVVEIDVAVSRRYALYVKRGKCGYIVGDVELSGEIEETKDKVNDFTVLGAQIICKAGPCNKGMQRVEFDGSFYRVK